MAYSGGYNGLLKFVHAERRIRSVREQQKNVSRQQRVNSESERLRRSAPKSRFLRSIRHDGQLSLAVEQVEPRIPDRTPHRNIPSLARGILNRSKCKRTESRLRTPKQIRVQQLHPFLPGLRS